MLSEVGLPEGQSHAVEASYQRPRGRGSITSATLSAVTNEWFGRSERRKGRWLYDEEHGEAKVVRSLAGYKAKIYAKHSKCYATPRANAARKN